MGRKRLIIVGNGMAASRLLDDLLRRDALCHYAITVFGDEPGGCYNRILLSKVLAGCEAESIMLKPTEWYEQNGIELVPSRVTRLDTSRRLADIQGVHERPYDVAVLATGSVAFVPKIEGLNGANGRPKPGVFIYRTLDDVLQLRSAARSGDNAVVLGGGLLGLEAARTLADLGLHVTVVHLLDTLMNQQLDRAASEVLRRQIERSGIFVRTGRTTQAVLGDRGVQAVALDDGTVLAADLLVLACGIRPRTELARASGLPCAGGILVNDSLATPVPGVYAVGECAEHAGRIYGIVAPIWEQTAVLADILSGANPRARYPGSRLYTRLKVAGIEVASMGLTEPALPDDQVVQVIEERKLAYRKLIIRDRRLVGAILVGDTEAAAALAQAFDRDEILPDNPLAMLLAPSGLAAPPRRIVCNCASVTDSRIHEAIAEGAGSVAAIGQRTGAGAGCGSCRSELVRLIAAAKTASSAPPAPPGGRAPSRVGGHCTSVRILE